MQQSTAKWAITGGTGFVGGAIVRLLQAEGRELERIHAPRLAWEDAEEPTLDAISVRFANTINDVATQLAGVEVLINAAGLATPDAQADGALIGANSVLPAVLAFAAERAGVRRYVHLSSAAVQGARKVLDETPTWGGTSPYARSKIFAEQLLLGFVESRAERPNVVILRATSVQGEGRETTEKLIRYARSPFAVVAAPGSQPTVVSTVNKLAQFVLFVGKFPERVPVIVLQPTEGLSVHDVLCKYGGKAPILVPAWLVKPFMSIAYASERVLLRGSTGRVRRIEVALFGQEQAAGWAEQAGYLGVPE